MPKSSEFVDDTSSQRDHSRADPPLQPNLPPPAAQVPPIPLIAVHIDVGLGVAIAQAITVAMTARDQ